MWSHWFIWFESVPTLENSTEVCDDCIVGKQHKEDIPKVVNWSIYVQNKSQSIHCCENITLHEAWSGIKPSVHSFHVFGCIGHVK